VTSKRDLAIVVSALKHAAPYIRLFKGKVFVLKAGGEIFADRAATTALMEQVGILHQVGIRVVLIHGGGPQSTQLATALGVDTTFVDGRRVTDGASLDVATMVLNGQINTRVLVHTSDRRSNVKANPRSTTASSATSTPSMRTYSGSSSTTASCRS
jgi:acetylglutamate kinase